MDNTVELPACYGLTDLFYSPEIDGREEVGRAQREEQCKRVCFKCTLRLRCLQRSLELHEGLGVWGGMGEGERRKFRRHLEAEGYRDEVPELDELRVSLSVFYRARRLERDAS